MRWALLVPVVTFLLGLALGAAVLGATRAGEPSAPVTSPVAVSPQPTPPDPAVAAPDPCLQAVDQAEVAYRILDDAVTAARELDARRLQELVDQVQQERARTQTLVGACRAQAAAALGRPTPGGGG